MASELKKIRDQLKGVKKQKSEDVPRKISRPPIRRTSIDRMNPDQLKNAKWERMFYQFFDTNKNGVIEWNDFVQLADRIRDIRGEDSDDYAIVHEASRVIWIGLLAQIKECDIGRIDPDVDHNVKVEDWVDIWKGFSMNRMTTWQKEYLKFMFFLCDTSGDKKIDISEYCQAMTVYGMSQRDAKEAFYRLTVDSEGNEYDAITWGMFVRLWEEFFVAGDSSKPGNYLFGTWL